MAECCEPMKTHIHEHPKFIQYHERIYQQFRSGASMRQIADEIKLVLQELHEEPIQAQYIMERVLLRSVQFHRKDMICHLLATHYHNVSERLHEALLYSTIQKHMDINKVLLEAGVCPFVPVNLITIYKHIPGLESEIQDIVQAHKQRCPDDPKLCSWQVILIQDNVQLLQQLDSITELDKKQLQLYNSKLDISRKVQMEQLYPVHSSCLFKSYKCLEYLLKTEKFTTILKSTKDEDIKDRKKQLTTLFWVANRDRNLLELLFKYKIFEANLEKMESPEPVLSSMLHHVTSCGLCPYLNASMLELTDHISIGPRATFDSNTAGVIEFLLSQGEDKHAEVYSTTYFGFVRPMTLVCTNVDFCSWLSNKESTCGKELDIQECTSRILKIMEILEFPYQSLTEGEINPLDMLLNVTINILNGVEMYMFNGTASVQHFINSVSNSLYISRSIFSWLINRKFEFSDKTPKQGNVQYKSGIFCHIRNFLERIEFLINCIESDILQPGSNHAARLSAVNDTLHSFQTYFKETLLDLYHHGHTIHLDDVFCEAMFHPALLYIDPNMEILKILLAQSQDCDYLHAVQNLHRWGNDMELNVTGEENLVFDYIQTLVSSPRSLYDSCRITIVRAAKQDMSRLQELNLPKSIQKNILTLCEHVY